MAIFFSYFELAAAIFVLLMSFNLFNQHNDRRSARFFAKVALVGFITAILEYSTRIAFTLEIAQYINRFSSVLWSLTFAMFLHFTIILTKNDDWLKKKLTYLLIYAPVVALGTLFIFTNSMYYYYEIKRYGIVNQPAPLYILYVLQTIVFMGSGIILLIKRAITTSHFIYRNQLLIIATGASIASIIGIYTDEITPLLYKTRVFPPTCVFCLFIISLFVYIAMRRYSLFALSPQKAADIIIETMPDSLILTNLEGRIIHLNIEAQKFFHVPKSEIIGKYFESLFKNPEEFKNLKKLVVDSGKEIKNFEAILIDPKSKETVSLINANKIHDHFGTTIGVVYIIRDICLCSLR